MDYFILEVHPNYTPPNIQKWNGKLDTKTLKEKQYDLLSEHLMFLVSKDMQMIFTDLITFPCFMVSKEGMEVIRLYEPFLVFAKVILFDEEKKKSKVYYIPFLEEVDCLTENSRFNLDRSVIHYAQVDGTKIKERTIVQIGNVNRTHILIRLDLAESLLRRNFIGMGLVETDTIYSIPSKMETI